MIPRRIAIRSLIFSDETRGASSLPRLPDETSHRYGDKGTRSGALTSSFRLNTSAPSVRATLQRLCLRQNLHRHPGSGSILTHLTKLVDLIIR